MKFENHLPRFMSVMLHIGHEALNVQELRDRSHLFRFLVDHNGRADATVRVAAARNLSPIGIRPVDDVRKVGKCTHQRKREPVARRFCDANLALNVVGKVGQRITLLKPPLLGDHLVAARKGNRLESDEQIFFGSQGQSG